VDNGASVCNISDGLFGRGEFIPVLRIVQRFFLAFI
jgi:hypothetical protein